MLNFVYYSKKKNIIIRKKIAGKVLVLNRFYVAKFRIVDIFISVPNLKLF